MYLSSSRQSTYFLARQAGSGALEIHSTAMIEGFFSPCLYRADWQQFIGFFHSFGCPFAGVKGSSLSKGSLSRQRSEVNNRILRSLLWPAETFRWNNFNELHMFVVLTFTWEIISLTPFIVIAAKQSLPRWDAFALVKVTILGWHKSSPAVSYFFSLTTKRGQTITSCANSYSVDLGFSLWCSCNIYGVTIPSQQRQ